jgi:hypothetical protein
MVRADGVGSEETWGFAFDSFVIPDRGKYGKDRVMEDFPS